MSGRWWKKFLARHKGTLKVNKAKVVEAVRLYACTTEKLERFHVDLQAEMQAIESKGGVFGLLASLDEGGDVVGHECAALCLRCSAPRRLNASVAVWRSLSAHASAKESISSLNDRSSAVRSASPAPRTRAITKSRT